MDKNSHFEFDSSQDKFGFVLTMSYLLIEYGRPMDIIPAIGFLRPGMILAVLLALTLLLKRNIHQAKGKQTTLLIIFVFLLALWVPFARNNYFAFTRTKEVALYIIFFISAIIYVNSFSRLKNFMRIWIFLSIYLAIRGILGKGVAGSNFLQDENDFSLLMVTMLPFSFFLFLYENNFKKKLLYVLSCFLATISITVSYSRGGFIGLVAISVIMWLFSPKKIISIFIIGFLALNIYLFSAQTYWDRIGTITQIDTGSIKERLDSWQAAWDMFKDNPLGVGGGNFPVRFPEYQPETMTRGMWGRVAHSIWFTIISELGIIGIILFSLLIYYNFRDIKWLRNLRESNDDDLRYAYYLSLSLFVSFIGFFVSGSFISVLYYPHLYYLTAMLVVVKRLASEKSFF